MVEYNNRDGGPKESDALLGRGRTRGGTSSLLQADQDDRNGFIRKVYAILSAQLAFTFGGIAMTKGVASVDAWMEEQAGLAIAAIILAIIPQCMILCCKENARRVPTNYLLLGAFTFLETFFFMHVTSLYDATSVISAAGMTLVMTVAITLYAFYTKTDFTACASLFLCLFVGMICLSLVSIFFTFAEWWHPVASAAFVVIYGLYLIFDTQLIAGGKSHQLSVDDYVIGALLIYVDIMMIFLELLKLFGNKK